jgi:2-(1,2-epoxy-1,2-dihydrophenyl)acetyl-CoA isomerase
MSALQTVVVSQQGHVATILLNRPESLNSFNRVLRCELYEALQSVASNSDIRVVVLGGVGRGFSSGADLNEGLLPGQTVDGILMDEYWPTLKLLADMDQTVIAANPGVMAGIGCAFVLNCDLSVMAEQGSMIMAFTNIGLVPDGGLTSILIQKLGYQRAYKLIAEGGRLDAQGCLDAGLVTRLTPAENVLETAQQWAAELAQRPPIALREAKQLLRNASTQSYVEVVVAEAKAQIRCITTEDSQEAVLAFIEKRSAVFLGR